MNGQSRILRSLLFALVTCGGLWSRASHANPIEIRLKGYVLSEGTRQDYFSGKLLTADALGGDQSYLLGDKRYLGPTASPLEDLFRDLGLADIVLLFDDSALIDAPRSEPQQSGDPHHDDMVFLDADTHHWRGRLFLPGVNGSAGSVYDDLAGSFSSLVTVPEPASLGLSALALAALLRRRPALARA